jgi:hypothetical protein
VAKADLKADGELLRDDLLHLAALEEGAVPELTIRHIADPDDILDRQWFIETVLMVQVGDITDFSN